MTKNILYYDKKDKITILERTQNFVNQFSKFFYHI